MDFGLLYENDTGEYVVLNDVRIADIRLASLVYLFVYVSTNCVPIAHLRQNKPFPLLYLGHAQIIINNYWMRLSMIAIIIKAKVCDTCQSQRLRRITQTEALIIIAIMRKPNPEIVLLCITDQTAG